MKKMFKALKENIAKQGPLSIAVLLIAIVQLLTTIKIYYFM